MSEHGWFAPWPDLRAQAWQSAQVRAQWAQVEVDPVDLVRTGSTWRLRAIVRLGGLAPADVRVDVIPARSPTDEHVAPWALWASQSGSARAGCHDVRAARAAVTR